MPFQISCPNCKKVMSVADDLQGKNTYCQDCGRVMAVPVAAKPKTGTPSSALNIRPPERPKTSPPVAPSNPKAAERPKTAPPAPAISPIQQRPKAAPPPKSQSIQANAPPAPPRPSKVRKPTRLEKQIIIIRQGLSKGWVWVGLGIIASLSAALVAFVIINRPGGNGQQVALADPGVNRNQEANSDSTSTPKPDPKPTTEPKPDLKPDPKPYVAPETKPEPRPEVKPEPEPEIKPEPKPKPPPPKPDPHAGKPLPEKIGQDTVARVKDATVYLRVTTPTGQKASGSGFLCVDPGIVMTNAHVLGMLSAHSRPPKKVDVVVHSGDPKRKLDLVGEVLGVDRSNDLAVVRIKGKLPDPLHLELGSHLTETQKVYIFGFPFGESLGEEITVSESSVSSLRRNPGGGLDRIQVNGGMHPGNSGGPVVNSLGQLVGVSVAGIPGTQINFAIPVEHVKLVLDGRVLDQKLGEPFMQRGSGKLPVQFTCLDAFKRINEVKVEVWTGKPGPDRPHTLKQPEPLTDDGPKQIHSLEFDNGIAWGDIPFPKLEPGQVAWLQPVLSSSVGTTVWGAAKPTEPGLVPLERKPAGLHFSLTAQKERTVHLQVAQGFSLIEDDHKSTTTDRAELDLVEQFGPDPQGALVRIGFGLPSVWLENNGKKATLEPEIAELVRKIPPVFVIDGTNKLRQRSDITLKPSLPPKIREYATDYYNEICNAYEAANLVMPNREVQPQEFWFVQTPMLMKTGRKAEVVDLMLNCTHQGTRRREGREEALISLAGLVQGRGTQKGKVDGKVVGKVAFDLKDGFVSYAKMVITSEAAFFGDLRLVSSLDVNLSRVPGNPKKIEVPIRGGGGPVKGEVIAQTFGALGPMDPLDADPKLKELGARAKLLTVNMQAGKKYVLQLNSNQFDCFLRLLDGAGNVVASDDDSGGGLNARIDFDCTVTATYGIVVTSFDGKMGQFQLVVTRVK